MISEAKCEGTSEAPFHQEREEEPKTSGEN